MTNAQSRERHALELARDRLRMLMDANLPDSDHPTATQYVLTQVEAALADQPAVAGAAGDLTPTMEATKNFDWPAICEAAFDRACLTNKEAAQKLRPAFRSIIEQAVAAALRTAAPSQAIEGLKSILRSISGALSIPYTETGVCEDPAVYEREIEALMDTPTEIDLRRQLKDMTDNRDAWFKTSESHRDLAEGYRRQLAERDAEIERLRSSSL